MHTIAQFVANCYEYFSVTFNFKILLIKYGFLSKNRQK